MKPVCHYCIKKRRLYSPHRRPLAFFRVAWSPLIPNSSPQCSRYRTSDSKFVSNFSRIRRQDVTMETEYSITQMFYFSDIVSIICFVFHILLQINVNNKFLNFIHPFTFDMNFTAFSQISS